MTGEISRPKNPLLLRRGAKQSIKRQLHTTHVGAVGWEPYGSSPTTCAGKADHGFGVCVPLASSLSFEKSELNCSTA